MGDGFCNLSLPRQGGTAPNLFGVSIYLGTENNFGDMGDFTLGLNGDLGEPGLNGLPGLAGDFGDAGLKGDWGLSGLPGEAGLFGELSGLLGDARLL